MRLSGEQKIKLANFLNDKYISRITGEDDEPCRIVFTNQRKWGFYDFSFHYDDICIRLFGGEDEWRIVNQLTDYEIVKAVNAFQQLTNELRKIGVIDNE